MTMANPAIHASCLEIMNIGVLIRGRSGSGKSSLTLRLIDEAIMANQQAKLVSDDYVNITQIHENLIASAPDTIEGLLEIRGYGIISLKPLTQTPIGLVVDLVTSEEFERLPDESSRQISLHGVTLPRVMIRERNPEASTIVRSVIRSLKLGSELINVVRNSV